MALLNREGILGADDMQTKDVPVPEWGGEVRIRMLTGTERDAFEASTIEQRKDGTTRRNLVNLRARLIAECVVVPDGPDKGRKMFVTADVKALGNKSAPALQRLFDACQEFNSFSDDDVAELAQGFDDAPSESSTSD